MNPKRKTSENKARSTQLLDLVKQLEDSRNDPEQFRSKLALYTEVVNQVPDDSAEVRPDVRIQGAHNQERWLDVGYVHTTKASGRAANLSFFKELPKAERRARELGVPAALSRKL